MAARLFLLCALAVIATVGAQPQQPQGAASASTAAAQPAPAAAGQNITLPALPYAYGDMEPAIDARTMDIHWNRHTQTYVNNLNAAINRCPGLRGKSLNDLVSSVGLQQTEADSACARDVRNNGGGTWNHFLFFLHVLAPYKSQSWDNDASPSLKRGIDDAFGNFTNFRTQFRAAAASVFGSGWAWLCWDPKARKLAITTTPNQDNPLMRVVTLECSPFMGLDVWEHAYYLKYQNLRANYTEAVFDNTINWKEMSRLYDQVRGGQAVTLP